jgi:nucleoside-diphosphate-sugar epimerase
MRRDLFRGADNVPEQRILVTGAAGLIGRALAPVLRRAGFGVVPFDRASDPMRDVTDTDHLRDGLSGIDGVIHLAAVSRVAEGERDPDLCRRTNVDAIRTLLRLAMEEGKAPWFIQASSREVYGQQEIQPVAEDAPLLPCNVYARTKVEGERLTDAARASGMATAILRFSNVFGDTLDHADRVVPAFARAAAWGGTVRVDGSDCAFDFTHVSDVADGVLRVVQRLSGGDRTLPPIHLVSGRQTSLGALADLAGGFGAGVTRVEAPARNFDIHRFVGDPRRAEALLGWRATTPLEAGLARLVNDYRAIERGSAARR